ncbi:hypothetical protein GE061_018655 [Apolygus lucorum]|uniref:Uncharacterized protein n=1 Tax=Apolygus lucorum TaxID=248454 RepID=A0A8S9XEM5_APOLU|nr:hypothetical protein GE061_018655 [Apolygus lucorum]
MRMGSIIVYSTITRCIYTSTYVSKVAHIDPLILYQRLLLQQDPPVDLSSCFKFEIAPFLMALFTSIGKRKNVKSAMRKIERYTTYVIDGGHLLHAVEWNVKTNRTYSEVCNGCVTFIDDVTDGEE